jgi:hypothetical protein
MRRCGSRSLGLACPIELSDNVARYSQRERERERERERGERREERGEREREMEMRRKS